MSTELKKRVLENYRKKKEDEKKEKESKENMEQELEEIIDSIIKKKTKENIVNSDSTIEEEDELSDENIKFKVKDIDENEKSVIPYFYIDYDSDVIKTAKTMGYNTLYVDKSGLTKKNIDDIISGKLFNLSKTHLIINLWRVITKSNLNTFSYDCSTVIDKKFKNKIETTFKWGSKSHLKEKMTADELEEYSLFRDDVPKMLKSLYNANVKIFIVCNSHYSFVERILQHYKLDKYVEEIFTPSKCGLPHGKLVTNDDSYKDGRKINKARVFACIERYIGRLPIN